MHFIYLNNRFNIFKKKMSIIVFHSLIYSYLSAWIIYKFFTKKYVLIVMFFILSILWGLLDATRDPANSAYIFIYSTFVNLILTPFLYFIFFRNTKIEVSNKVEVILPGDLEEKFQQFKKWFYPVIFLILILCIVFLYS